MDKSARGATPKTAAKAGTAIRQKMVRPQIKVLDLKSGLVEAVVSTEDKDRDGDIIRQSGWELGDFMAHPVLVSSHSYNLRSQIGEWTSMDVKGKKLIGTARYYVGEGNEEADWGFNLAAKGRAAYSVGFIPDISKAKEIEDSASIWGSYEFNGQKLLEVSHVVIPSNPKALQQVKGLKGLDPVVRAVVDEVLSDNGGQSGDGMGPDQIKAIAEQVVSLLIKRFGEQGLALIQRTPQAAQQTQRAANPLQEVIGRWS